MSVGEQIFYNFFVIALGQSGLLRCFLFLVVIVTFSCIARVSPRHPLRFLVVLLFANSFTVGILSNMFHSVPKTRQLLSYGLKHNVPN